jgi:hypothetical protein
MTENLPAKPLPDDVVDKVAREVALELSAYIEMMYPQIAAQSQWASLRVSMHGMIRNHMGGAAKAAEEGRIDAWLKIMRANRRSVVAAWKKAMAA